MPRGKCVVAYNRNFGRKCRSRQSIRPGWSVIQSERDRRYEIGAILGWHIVVPKKCAKVSGVGGCLVSHETGARARAVGERLRHFRVLRVSKGGIAVRDNRNIWGQRGRHLKPVRKRDRTYIRCSPTTEA